MAADTAIFTLEDEYFYFAPAIRLRADLRRVLNLFNNNRKPYPSFQMVLLSMTLSDPSSFEGHGVIFMPIVALNVYANNLSI